jgi:hypothetical protein
MLFFGCLEFGLGMDDWAIIGGFWSEFFGENSLELLDGIHLKVSRQNLKFQANYFLKCFKMLQDASETIFSNNFKAFSQNKNS